MIQLSDSMNHITIKNNNDEVCNTIKFIYIINTDQLDCLNIKKRTRHVSLCIIKHT